MNTARKLVAALIAIAASTLSPAALAVRSKVCPHCSTATMQATARAAGLGEFYVWDPYANGLMRKYYTYCGSPEVAAGGSAPDKSAGGVCGVAPLTTEEVSVEAAYLEAAPHLAVLYVASGGTYHFGADLNSGGKTTVAPEATTSEPRGLRIDLGGQTWQTYYPMQPSAKDYHSDGNLRAQVKDYLYRNGMSAVSNNVLRKTLEFVAAHVDSMMSFTSGVVITFEPVFADGSTLLFSAVLGQQPVYIKDSGRDATGQLVPEGNSAEYAGRWRYSSTDDRFFRDLIDLLGKYNIPITILNPHGRFIRCDWDGRTLRCIIPQ